MARQTIDFGIDLGTTNSAIAVLSGTDAEVVRNNENDTTTPSAVWVDEGGAVVVGHMARGRYFQKPDDAAIEFKRLMGDDAPVEFASSGRTMLPEELSAEVLKSLKADALLRLGEEPAAAVITVPAEFGLAQCEATDRAAKLAGITQSPLFQEPVAAALAYGFQAADEDVFWMVYDMGGGTFDAAIIQMADGMIEVVNHGGDHYLGGKVLDWAIVEKLLIPAVEAAYDVEDFQRGNDKWLGPMAKLKMTAEDIKIQLSRQDTAQVDIDYLGMDEAREPMMDFTCTISRTDVERLMEPLIARSINIVRQVLTEKQLGPDDIDRLLLVGGPSAMPYLRERLADPDEGLGIELEFSQDPMTVVARGAAIFAGTQRIATTGPPPSPDSGVYQIELEYDPIGPDTDPLIGGCVTSPTGESVEGCTIEFVNVSLPLDDWSSGQIPLGEKGTFTAGLFAEKGFRNEFRIDLRDPTGSPLQALPEIIPYTIGGVPDKPILTHSIGVAMVNNELDLFFEKGTSLAAHKRSVHQTVFPVRRNQQGDLIQIPVMQGENIKRADRNKIVGEIEIPASEVARDVPQGSDVEITIDIDESQRITARAYVPILDQTFEKVLELGQPKPEIEGLRDDLHEEKQRLADAGSKARDAGASSALRALERIENEELLSSAEAALEAAAVDADALRQCDDLLRRLRIAIDEVEEALQWPALVATAEEKIEEAQGLVADPEFAKFGGHEDVDVEVTAVNRAIQSEDVELLQARLDELSAKIATIIIKHPAFWLAMFAHLKEQVDEMTDPARARQLVSEGDQALRNSSLPSLEAVCRELQGLVRSETAMPTSNGIGGTEKKY